MQVANVLIVCLIGLVYLEDYWRAEWLCPLKIKYSEKLKIVN